MSLGGLALGVGMLDDCAVVVSENIFRHRSLGKGLKEAAYIGTKEVGPAVVSTALTTIVVFLPVIYVHGVAGQLFKDTALTVTFALLASLLVSLTLIATLESREFDLGVGTQGRWKWSWGLKKFPVAERPLYALFKGVGFVLNFLVSFFVQLFAFVVHYLALPFRPVLKAVFSGFNAVYGRFIGWYQRFLSWSLDHKGRVMAWTLVFFAVTFALGGLIRRELMPRMETTTFELDLKMPVDFSFEQTTEMAVMLEGAPPRPGPGQDRPLPGRHRQRHGERRPQHLRQLGPHLRRGREAEAARAASSTPPAPRLAQFPDIAYTIVREQSTVSQFLALSTAEIGLQVKGQDLDRLKEIADGPRRPGWRPSRASPTSPPTSARASPSSRSRSTRRPSRDTPASRPRRSATSWSAPCAAGWPPSSGRWRRSTTSSSASRTPRGRISRPCSARPCPSRARLVPLRDLVSYEVVRGPREIRRENQQREVLVTANLKGRKISQVTPAIDKAIAGLRLPTDYRVVWSGEREEMRRSFRASSWPCSWPRS